MLGKAKKTRQIGLDHLLLSQLLTNIFANSFYKNLCITGFQYPYLLLLNIRYFLYIIIVISNKTNQMASRQLNNMFSNSKIQHNLSHEVNVHSSEQEQEEDIAQNQMKNKESNFKNLPKIPQPQKNRKTKKNQQIENEEDQWCDCQARRMYQNLLQQFTSYKEQVIKEKQGSLQETIKNNQHLNRTYQQISKKYEAAILENKQQYEKKMTKMQNKYQQIIKDLSQSLNENKEAINKMNQELRLSQTEKLQLIENNTKMLYQISNSDDLWDTSAEFVNKEDQQENRGRGKYRNSYQQLVKLYQFVLEENNGLKKQLYRKNMENASILTDHDVLENQIKPSNTKDEHKAKNLPKKAAITKAKGINSRNASQSVKLSTNKRK